MAKKNFNEYLRNKRKKTFFVEDQIFVVGLVELNIYKSFTAKLLNYVTTEEEIIEISSLPQLPDYPTLSLSHTTLVISGFFVYKGVEK